MIEERVEYNNIAIRMNTYLLNPEGPTSPGRAVTFVTSVALCVVLGGANPALGEQIDFNRDVRQILSDKCFLCHGPAEDSLEAGLRLDLRREAIDYGAIVPHDPDASLLVERIESDDDELRMPPPSSNKTLSARQKEILRQWIAAGAPYDKHWSFKRLPAEIKPPDQGSEWARSDVDRFVLKSLLEAGLKPNEKIDRRTWLRRVTFDLTGLPPTPKEIEKFLADDASTAYEAVVDRLQSSDAYAERLTSEWLDVARYSDSYGYQRDDARFVWPYRDWVIDSFKKNRPYDEFVTWQLAGDLLPNATLQQRLATVFCRLHSHKKEGGVAVEEFRVENVADRTHTFASAFLGLTMECARCHDHKYDPISTKDYYELSSYFANIDERGLISYFTDATPTPAMPLPDAEQERELADAQVAVQHAEKFLDQTIESARVGFAEWLTGRDSAEPTVPGLVASVNFDQLVDDPPEEVLFDEDTGFVEVDKKTIGKENVLAFANSVAPGAPAISRKANQVVQGRHGDGVRLTGDDGVVLPNVGHIRRSQPLTVSLWVKPAETKQRGVILRRSGGWDDAGSMGYALIQHGARLRANMVHFWPGNAICVATDAVLKPGQWTHVTVTYDGSRTADGLRIYVDGQHAVTKVVQDSLTRTIRGWRGGYEHLAIGSRYRDRGFTNGVVDECRVFDRELTSLEVRHNYDGQSLITALGKKKDDLNPAEIDELFDYYLNVVDQEAIAARASLGRERRRWDDAMDATTSITVMREQPQPRPAYILERGRYDAHGERVQADTPAILPPFPSDAPRDRLGLAQWLFDPEHPLTARVAVNRYWQMIFGAGLVNTPEDFGRQGAPPTHPELLDWLARDFVDNGWDVRRMLKMLVLSSTYRQSSVVDPSVRAIDPENRLLSRGPNKQLPAEMVRDNALVVSGLLKKKVGGPPVKPYDLKLAYEPLEVDSGEALYRRSLYTFWKRTSPSPVMMTMNANRREVCLLRRDSVSSPLQALVLLNGTQFVEASRSLADRLIEKHPQDLDAIIAEAFELLTSRTPTSKEATVLKGLHEEQLRAFRSDPAAAQQLVRVGSVKTSVTDPAQLAATTVVVNSIMNLDEAIRCR